MSTSELIGCVYRKDYLGLDKLVMSGNINEVDDDGRSPLIHAVLAGDANEEMVKYLLAKGADPSLQDKGQKWTPLHFAARDQKLSIEKFF